VDHAQLLSTALSTYYGIIVVCVMQFPVFKWLKFNFRAFLFTGIGRDDSSGTNNRWTDDTAENDRHGYQTRNCTAYRWRGLTVSQATSTTWRYHRWIRHRVPRSTVAERPKQNSRPLAVSKDVTIVHLINRPLYRDCVVFDHRRHFRSFDLQDGCF
jgi:hypothetical protein